MYIRNRKFIITYKTLTIHTYVHKWTSRWYIKACRKSLIRLVSKTREENRIKPIAKSVQLFPKRQKELYDKQSLALSELVSEFSFVLRGGIH